MGTDSKAQDLASLRERIGIAMQCHRQLAFERQALIVRARQALSTAWTTAMQIGALFDEPVGRHLARPADGAPARDELSELEVLYASRRGAPPAPREARRYPAVPLSRAWRI